MKRWIEFLMKLKDLIARPDELYPAEIIRDHKCLYAELARIPSRLLVPFSFPHGINFSLLDSS